MYVLLRPRAGGFTCSDGEFETMRRDAEWFLRSGADGIVFGILNCPHGANEIDRERCRELVRLAGGRAVFHRAFDFLPERWLGRKPGTYEWIPFGGGIRRCLGAALAMAEQRVVLEAMARRLDLEAEDPAPEQAVHRNVTMIPSRGATVIVRARV